MSDRPPGVPEGWECKPCRQCRRPTWFDPQVQAATIAAGKLFALSCSDECSEKIAQKLGLTMATFPSDSPLTPHWDNAALNPGLEIDIGRMVACDDCGTDYTDSPNVGGFIWQNRATCPRCAVTVMTRLREHQLLGLLRDGKFCQPGTSFADFVRASRPHNKIKVNRP